MTHYIVDLCGNLLEWYICTNVYSLLHHLKISPKKALFLGGLFTLFQFINNCLFLEKSSLVVVGSIIYFFLLSLLYDSKWHWKILESLFVFIVLVVPEILLAMFLELILKVDVSYLQANLIYFTICTFTTKLISLFLVKALRIRKLIKSISAPVTIILPMLFLPIATVTVSALIVQSGYLVQNNSVAVLGLISTVLLMVANLVMFWVIEHLNEYIQTKDALRFAQAHIQTQIEHYKDLYTFQTEIRKTRHDIHNKMLSLFGLLQAGDIELAKELISKEMPSSSEVVQIVDSGNPVIDAVLQSKREIAASKHIVLSTHIQLEEKIEMNNLELGVLIGNAVDNAIEACEKIADDKHPEIMVRIHALLGRIILSVSNPTVEERGSVVALKSSKHDANGHGFGLNSIRSIVDKYDGTLTIKWQDYCFIIEIGLSNHPLS